MARSPSAAPARAAPPEPVAGTMAAGFAWGLVTVLIWAGWMVATRLGVTTTLSVYDLTALRFGAAGLVLLPVVLRRGLALDRLGPGGLALLVAGAGAPYAIVAGFGFAFAPVHDAALIPGTMPVFVALLSAALFGERIAPRRGAGLALVLVGVGVLVGASLWQARAPAQWLGYGFFLLAAWLWACFTLVVQRARLDPLHATGIVAVGSAVLFLPVYLLLLDSRIPEAPVADVLVQTVYQGILTSIVALVAYGRVVRLLGSTRGAAIASLVPVAATLLAIPVLGEWPSVRDMGGVVLISLGVALATGARVGVKKAV